MKPRKFINIKIFYAKISQSTVQCMLFTNKPVKIHISEFFLLNKLMYRVICLTVLATCSEHQVGKLGFCWNYCDNALSDWSVKPFLDNGRLQIYLELCSSIVINFSLSCHQISMSASIVALFSVHLIKSALIFVQFNTFYALLLFSLLPFSRRPSHHVARAISPVTLCNVLCVSLLSSGGWIAAVRSCWVRKLQGVCVMRKNAGKKHGGCSSRRMNVWHWHFHRSSSTTNWWAEMLGGGGGEMVVLITGTSTQPSIPTSLHTLVF